jgi:thiol-disulfide isomerase/thioredoxin/uncharacterized membrane protein YphA (DoxX/SURF4 family)
METVVLALRLILAVVFIAAGVGKLLDVRGSRRAVRDFGVPEEAARVVGVLLPIAEVIVGIALIFRPSARWAAIVALLLLAAFVAGIGAAMARGETPDCHCFGQIHSAPAGKFTLVRNVVLAAFALVILAYGSGPAVDSWVGARSASVLVAIGAGICAVAAVAYALALRSGVKTLEADLETARKKAAMGQGGLQPGVQAPEFALKDLQGDTITLSDLRDRGAPVLLLFMTPWCGPCASFTPTVQQWQQTLSERLTIAIISAGTAEQNATFEEQGLEDVLLQDEMELAAEYRIGGTPTALVVSQDGKIASNPAEMAQGIEPLVRLTIRRSVTSPMAGTVG